MSFMKVLIIINKSYREVVRFETNLKYNAMKKSYIYILKYSDETYFKGVINNTENRIVEHNQGIHVNAYTYNRRPFELVFHMECKDIY